MRKLLACALFAATFVSAGLVTRPARADGNRNNVNHIIIIMQENHSFDNYLGVLPYVAGGVYHAPPGNTLHSNAPCPAGDHKCVDGLNCTRNLLGVYTCSNSNPDADGTGPVAAFHLKNYCPQPDLDHGWPSSHREANFSSPNDTLLASPNDGFVNVNDATSQKDNGVESATEDETMGFYNEKDLPYYYAIAQTFAISDRYFCDVIGPTLPNRFYFALASSFGHTTTSEIIPPTGGYKPKTGTIFDLLDAAGVQWVDYYSDLPQAAEFRNPLPPNFQPVPLFFAAAAAGQLAPVVLVDPLLAGETNLATDEHPPHDIRSGEVFVAQVINAIRSGPNWKDSVIVLNYDEHGGFYDHVAPPAANQGGARTPDGIFPGQCSDATNPAQGTGANCANSMADAVNLCPTFTATGPYPPTCAAFDQLGFRVPMVAISPFSKPQYVSHVVTDHTSILKLIEDRFLGGHRLTLRDAGANSMEDLFDFDHSPSLNANVSPTLAPLPNLLTDGVNQSCLNQQVPLGLATLPPLPMLPPAPDLSTIPIIGPLLASVLAPILAIVGL